MRRPPPPRPRPNPRSVPDLYELPAPPYPYPYGDPSLTQAEAVRRWKEIQAYNAARWDTEPARIKAAHDGYDGLWAELVRGLGERWSAMRREGLLPAPVRPDQWVGLGREAGRWLRDLAALVLVDDVLDARLYNPGAQVSRAFGLAGGRRLGLGALRDAYEARAELLERWAVAQGAREARPEWRVAASLRPLGDAAARERVREDAAQRVANLLTQALADVANAVPPGGRVGVAEIADAAAAALPWSGPAGGLRQALWGSLVPLRRDALAAERLAARGAPQRRGRRDE